MGIKQLLLAVVLLISNMSFAAFAADNGWVLYTDSPIGSIYIHPDSVASDELGNKMLWIKVVNAELEDGVKSTKALNVYDCDSKKQGISHVIQYDKNNNVVKEFSLPTITAAKNTLDPDGFHYGIMKALCE